MEINNVMRVLLSIIALALCTQVQAYTYRFKNGTKERIFIKAWVGNTGTCGAQSQEKIINPGEMFEWPAPWCLAVAQCLDQVELQSLTHDRGYITVLPGDNNASISGTIPTNITNVTGRRYACRDVDITLTYDHLGNWVFTEGIQ